MTHDELLEKYKNCGSYAGWTKHYRAKETPCGECLIAKQEYNTKWKSDNPNKIKIFSKKYRTKHYELVRQYVKQYKEDNPDQYRAYSRANSRRRRSAYSEKYTEQQVLEMYGITCHICHKDINLELPRLVGSGKWQQGLHIDHLIPLSKGGTDTLANVRPSHGICNITKNGSMPDGLE